MTTTQRVSQIVTAHREVSGDAAFTSHSVHWIADEDGEYVEIDRGDSKGYVHILDWPRYQRNYPEYAGL